MIDGLPIELAGVAVRPAATHLFKVKDFGLKLKASEA